jgi:hypothetical protein
MQEKRGQVTIFIIIAITIVVGIAVFFIVRNSIKIENIPTDIQPLYNDFLSCLEDKTLVGISLLESQGGYIYLPELEQGSFNNPFSSQLDFFGVKIPYWYYFSASNLVKEQIPSKENMEEQLTLFLESKINECDLDKYYDQGFEITKDTPSVSLEIRDKEVDVNLEINMQVTTETDSILIKNYESKIKSNLGELYTSAKKIYDQEQSQLFLEEYGIDTLRLYAPVDGVEVSCSPKIWSIENVHEELKEAIEVNTLSLSTNSPSTQQEKYFFLDLNVDEQVKFFNFAEWPDNFEVNPSEDSLLIANPVGNQQGLGIIGFCYVPYHFVYNLKYPVLAQISKGEETFQFPVIVSIQGNKARTPLETTSQGLESNLCKYRNNPMTIKIFDSEFNLVNASVSFSCMNEECQIGTTSNGILETEFPQCVNGEIIVTSEGYAQKREIISSVNEAQVDIVLDKLYELDLEVNLGNVLSEEKTILSFVSENNYKTIIYPENNKINLSQGNYKITAYTYSESELEIPETTTQQCTSVVASGLAGILGLTEKSCVDVKTPSQILSSVLIGGGSLDYSLFEESLNEADTILINVESFSKPTSIEEVQKNYILTESSKLGVELI